MWMNTCHMKAEQATTNDSDKPCSMSSFSSDFDKTDAMFLEFAEELDNSTRGSSSVGDDSIEFNDQAMNRFIEHQMLSTFKKF
ncbi:cytochrome P450 CYP82D47-like [Cucumis melo var. makuwa]|uniref:Cytochrome P450 CYP82D47-like n=1 Tax=Cucumis melo var. makuwa TaxID=1194695 RepID=A0A5A7T5J7_CUCMM|nr:cytochrome P450 CYP82D47-like [Cucumis melo var. makuwa]TYK03367.1 cytochrome P450 CYP82D47-like [Cucumis melo var. makuwa]